MICGFSKHGRGDGDSPVGYLTDGAAIDYLTGKSKRSRVRNPAPVVLRGDPTVTRELINSSPHRWKYTSGVLSFSPGELLAPELEQKIIGRFEAIAFAGLKPDERNILWVRHAHLGRTELHYLIPRIHLATGKSLNVAPPGKAARELFDAFRRLTNDEFGFSDPDDPARARLVRVPSYIAKGKQSRADLRTEIGSYLETKLQSGVLKNRDDVLQLLRASGFEITRAGTNYVTVLDRNSGQRCRLKGALFEEHFAHTPASMSLPSHRLSPEQRAQLEARLAELVAARAAYNRERYAAPTIEPSIEPRRLEPKPLPLFSTYERTSKFAALCAAGLDARELRARADLGRLAGTTQRWRSAYQRFDGATRDTHAAARRVERTIGEFETFTFPRFQARAATKKILQKYRVELNRSFSRSFARDMELEMEMPR